MLRTIKTTLVLVTLLSFMEIYCSCAVVTKPVSASATASAENSEAVNQMTLFIKNIVNALFLDTTGNNPSRNSRTRARERAYDEWDNDLFNFNPKPDLFRYRYIQTNRKLTPIDLTKPFVFDDEEEILVATENSSAIPSEYLEEVSTFQKPEVFKSKTESDSDISPAVLSHTIPSGKSGNKSRGKVSDPKISGFIGLPIQSRGKLESSDETEAESKGLIQKRSPNSGSSAIIFPDDLEFNSRLRQERTTDAEADDEIECKEHETFHKSKCEMLFTQTPCAAGEHLVEDEETGEGKCLATNCRYPESVSLAGTDECVKLRYHTCPEGMRLTMRRSGQAECDCRPGFLYFAKDEKCYEAYKQGPCRQSQYLILHQPRNQHKREMPKCIRNPCKRHGFVCYGGQNCPRVERKEDCLELGSRCEDGRGTLVVNQTSLAVVCRTLTTDEGFMPGSGIETRILSQIPELACSAGTKKDITGTCRKTFRFNRRNGK